MAFTDITSFLDNTITGTTIAGAGTIKLEKGICSPYGFEVSAYQGTYLASDNLNIDSSCASMRLTFTKTGTTGVNIKLRYMVQSENNYDYGMFGKSGVTLTSAVTYSSSNIYSHTRAYDYTTPQILDYYLPSSSNIDILYRKDGSANEGWDRLFVAVMAEAASGGGGSGGDTYFWAGAKIYLRGEKNNYTNQYDFSTSQRINSVANNNSLLEYAGKTKFETITSGSLVVYWTSGTTDTDLGTNGSDITVGTTFGGVTGHGQSTLSTAKWRIYTGTTAASVMKAYATALSTAPVQLCGLAQNKYTVYVKTSSTGRPKAYYNITFPSTVGNVTYMTGKSGYVTLVTSAVSDNSLTVSASRSGSDTETATISPNIDVNISVPQSHRTDDRIETTDDLYQHDTSLAASYCGSNDHKCIKFDSVIHDSGSNNKLMWHNDFLSFSETTNYFNDDTVIGEEGSGYEIYGQSLTIYWTNSSPNTLQLTALNIFGGTFSDGTQLYRITSARSLAANSSGSFACGVLNQGYADSATALTVVVTTGADVESTLVLDTQSNGSYYFHFPIGTDTITLPLHNNITITGGTLRFIR